MSLTTALFMACNPGDKNEKSNFAVQLVTLDPGHFHAALVQKTMYDNVDSIVNIYAPEGNDLTLHLERINAFNNRKDNPTHWKKNIYSGNDFFETMLAEKKGNVVVVIAGNNRKRQNTFPGRWKQDLMCWPINPWLLPAKVLNADKGF
ncbi:MAG: hypothetical protein WDO71_00640 [Bacteroidota bacterium]